MSESSLKVLAVSGSLHQGSIPRVALDGLAELLGAAGCAVDMWDLFEEPMAMFSPSTSYTSPEYPLLKARVDRADVIVLSTPDYHGAMSGAMKNFLDHFWKEFAGKLFGTIVSSHEKGLTVADQLRTVARQVNAWAIPYAVALQDKLDVVDGEIVSDAFRNKLDMFASDLRVYGGLIAKQRSVDLAGTEPGFMARNRPS
jgi:NAD(P)H-dependent FMN reductase